MRLVLVRHGESICAVRGIIGGTAGCTGLTERGKAQAAALRDRWSCRPEFTPDVIYTSTLLRAVQTGEIVAGAFDDVPVKQDPDLCELVPGECDGTAWDDWRERYGVFDMRAEPDRPMSPGGESWNAFTVRVRNLLERMASEHEGQTVLASCHGGIVFMSVLTLFGRTGAEERARLHPDFTSVTEWVREPRRVGELPTGAEVGWRLVRYNDVAHIRGTELLDGE